MAHIGILGHGVVGSGVAEVLQTTAASITKGAGQEIHIKKILDRRDFPDCPYKDLFTREPRDILEDPEISVVVEVMGGVHPAYDYVKAALEAGKNAVSSNKEMVAEKGAELLALAAANGVNFFFEASVGGGIPILRPLHTCLAANEYTEILGILNGTTNFILTKMIRESMAFGDVLHMAQELGYAEADPTADVEGHDACRKICILASLAYGSHVYPKWVPTKGISGIAKEDVQFAERVGYVVKLLGQTRKLADGSVYATVGPVLLPESHILARVDDVFNAILVRGSNTGDVLFYGKGAGKLPTASAVVADIMHCVTASGTVSSHSWKDSGSNIVADHLRHPVSLYVRCHGVSKEKIAAALGPVQYLERDGQQPEELGFLTPCRPQGELEAQLKGLGNAVCNFMQVLDLSSKS